MNLQRKSLNSLSRKIRIQTTAPSHSSDGLKKKTKSLREKTDKKQGGQEGHEGHGLKIVGKPDKTVNIIPERCMHCPNQEKCKGKLCPGEKRYVVDVKIEQTLTEYCSLKVQCPMDKSELKGVFPENINGYISYGAQISSLLVALNTVGAVSTDRIKEIVGSILNLPISKGTMVSIVAKFSEKIKPVLAVIKERILGSSVVNCDETGTRVEGKTRWAHCIVTPLYTFLGYSQKRGSKEMNEIGVLPLFKGIIQHDCWVPYWKYDVDHAVCCAHLLRVLNGIIENHPEQKWAEQFRRLLLNMKKTKDVSIENDETSADKHYLDMYDKQYDEILKSAYALNPLPVIEGKKKEEDRRKERSVHLLSVWINTREKSAFFQGLQS